MKHYKQFFLDLSLDRIENVLILLKTTKSHQIETSCKIFLKHHINFQNIFEIWELAEQYNDVTLAELSKEFVMNNFIKVKTVVK